MASARQKCGKWYYRITVTVGDGSHKYIERGSFKTKREALRAGNKVELAYKDGETEVAIKARNMTVECLADEWLEASTRSLKASSITDYRKILHAHVTPKIGSYSITGLSCKQCQDVIDAMAQNGNAFSVIKNTKGCMSSMFKYALRCGYIKKNPVKDVVLPTKRSEDYKKLNPKREQRPLTRDEVRVIFNRFPEGSPCYISLILGYRCGLRIGEAFGLLIDDVDFRHHQLHIRRQIQEDYYNKNHWYFSPPKYCNPGEGRDIDLDPETEKILKKHINKIIEGMTMFHHKIYYISKDGLLNDQGDGKVVNLISVRYIDGSYVSELSMNRVNRVIQGKEGLIEKTIPEFHFHMLRHTHASDCLAAGMSPVSVQKRLGHKSLDTTLQYYIHETERDKTNSRKVLEEMFN